MSLVSNIVHDIQHIVPWLCTQFMQCAHHSTMIQHIVNEPCYKCRILCTILPTLCTKCMYNAHHPTCIQQSVNEPCHRRRTLCTSSCTICNTLCLQSAQNTPIMHIIRHVFNIVWMSHVTHWNHDYTATWLISALLDSDTTYSHGELCGDMTHLLLFLVFFGCIYVYVIHIFIYICMCIYIFI